MATAERVDRVDYGDPLAAPGTAAWAKRWAMTAAVKIPLIEIEPLNVQSHIELGVKYSVWELLADQHGKPFDSFDAFCEAPRPYGCGFPADKVRRVLAAIHGSSVAFGVTAGKVPRPGGKREGAGRKPSVEKDEGKNQSSRDYSDYVEQQERGSAYLAARIARDAPDVHERMKAGEFPSVRQAAIAAGVLKPPKTPKGVDPVRAAARAIQSVPFQRLAELACSLPVPLRRALLVCLKDAS